MTTFRKMTLLAFLTVFTLACSVSGTVEGHIPEEGKAGLRSVREEGYLRISKYMGVDPQQIIYYLGLFSGKTEDDGKSLRGWLIKNEKGQPLQEAYLGEFTRQFDDLPVQTLMFEANGMRFIAGYVEPQVPGTMDDIVFDRYTVPGKTEHFRKTANIKNGAYFVFPILLDEIGEWENIEFVGIRTVESLNQEAGHVSGNCSSNIYEICINYTRPKYIGDLFLPDPFADIGD